MGCNVNLRHMLGLAEKAECPRCKTSFDSGEDDFDIECGHPNPEPGVWVLRRWCPECEHEWTVRFTVTVGGSDGSA